MEAYGIPKDAQRKIDEGSDTTTAGLYDQPRGLEPGKDTNWQKSTQSGQFDCVEVGTDAAQPEARFLRDSKDPEGGTLGLSAGAFATFLEAVKAGEFNNPQ